MRTITLNPFQSVQKLPDTPTYTNPVGLSAVNATSDAPQVSTSARPASLHSPDSACQPPSACATGLEPSSGPSSAL